MAEKFLDDIDMDEVKEGMKMTRLGQMLMNDGVVSARKELIETKLQKGKTVEQIADALEMDVEEVKRLIDEM